MAAAVLLCVSGAQAAEPSLTIPRQDLAVALGQLSAQAHIQLLFDPARMTGRSSGPVRGATGVDEALSQMLAGTGFVARRGEAGVVLVMPQTHTETAPPKTDGGITAVAEVLVVGSRSLNTAIRRSEDDIQPYVVLSADTIAESQTQTLEEFLRTRDPDDAEAGSLTQAPVANGGVARSRIDLNGLGADQTLVLVDGRRLPSVPGQDVFQQPDLNGIPLIAIDRVESLTSTAGGIYGPGATGGALNVVLKRDYDGAELDANSGVSDRGDALHYRIEGLAGHSFFNGDTKVMVAFSDAHDDGLTVGQRDISTEARQTLLNSGYLSLPISPSLNVLSNVLFAGLSSSISYKSYKPLNLSLAAGGLAAIEADAGTWDASLPKDGEGALQSLLTRTNDVSAVLNVRQTLSPRIEAFFDLLYADDSGRAVGPRTQPAVFMVGPSSLLPQGGEVSLASPGLFAVSTDQLQTFRATAGAIVRLAYGWKSEIDLTYGQASDTTSTPSLPYLSDTLSTDQLVNGVDLASLFPTRYAPNAVAHQVNQMVDANLRLSGPLIMLPGGLATMTLLGEFRLEHQPQVESSFDNGGYFSLGAQTQSVGSAYAELRAPLLGRTALWPLRELTLQLAGRFDDETATVPGDIELYTPMIGVGGVPFHGGARTLAFTAGFSAKPMDGVMLRTSIATGYLPPSLAQMIQGSQVIPAVGGSLYTDPERGGRLANPFMPIDAQYDGSPTLQPELAQTLSAGFVLTPTWAPGLRLSLDYTRIEKSHEITDFASLNFQYFVDHEAEYPGRVIRAPLTPADIAAGYTGGQILDINTSLLNVGRSIVQTVELNASYTIPSRIGPLRLYARATWEPDYRRMDDPDKGFYQTAGYIDGPLTLRGNAGLDWSRGPWGAGLNVQAYSAYSVTYSPNAPTAVQSFLNVIAQGRAIIPAQAYVDLDVKYVQPLRLATGPITVEYRLGLHNLFDTQPPLLLITPSSSQPAESVYYSPYGDPRGRRIEVSIVGRF